MVRSLDHGEVGDPEKMLKLVVTKSRTLWQRVIRSKPMG